MDIPLNAEVLCTDGPAGQSTCIILNPIAQEVTHFVVSPGLLEVERLVPIDYITESTPQHIRLRCSQDELAQMPPFVEGQYLEADEAVDGWSGIFEPASVRLWPYRTAAELPEMESASEPISHDALAIHRGAHVEATDGRVGRVDEFLVSPVDNHISHLILREGHLWGQRDITIPVSDIERIEEDVVYLKLDKQRVHNLPGVPVQR